MEHDLASFSMNSFNRFCFLARRAVFLLTKDVMSLAQDERLYFYLGACSQGKIDAPHLVRTVSPAHTEVRVFRVFVVK